MRTQQEIEDRVEAVLGTDVFGWRQEVLLPYLDYVHAMKYLNPDVTAQEWMDITGDVKPPAQAGAEYFPFAVAKCEDERGLSANRSVMKLAEWAWLDGQDDLAAEMEAEGNYGGYGRGALELYAKHYGLAWDRGEN